MKLGKLVKWVTNLFRKDVPDVSDCPFSFKDRLENKLKNRLKCISSLEATEDEINDAVVWLRRKGLIADAVTKTTIFIGW